MAQNVSLIKKQYMFLLVLFALSAFNAKAQTKYFVLNDLDSNYKSFNYVLKTDSLYGLKDSILLYNLIYWDKPSKRNGIVRKVNGNDLDIIIFSVLPNLDGPTWEEVNYDSVKSSVVSFGDLFRIYRSNTFEYYNGMSGEKIKYWNAYKVLINRDNKFYTPKYVLLEFYAVRRRPEIFNNLIGTINTNQPLNPIQKVEGIFDSTFSELYRKVEFPLYTIRGNFSSRFSRLRDRKEFLSKKFVLQGKEVYQFWTFTDWQGDPYEYDFNRGIDRFLYMPGNGIIGGSYDFYFFKNRKKLNLTTADFIKNIRAEKIMIAEDI